MNIVTLAGPYPEEVYGLLARELPAELKIRMVKDQETLNGLTDMEFVILRTLKLDADVITANPGLKLIQRWGAGFDTVDVEAATAIDVPVTVAAGTNSGAVAEHALLLMLASYRHLIPLDESTRLGSWDRSTFSSRSFMISDKLVGLVGCGAIGRLVARKVHALGAAVQYYDNFRIPEDMESELGLTYVGLEELLATSDIVSLHLPLTDQTKDIIGLKELLLMKPNAILVNTSRGGLINEASLAAVLKAERIMGAALDSVSEEPYPADGQLREVGNLIMTPHIGGAVADLTIPMVRKVAENVIKVYQGLPVPRRDMVNTPMCSYPVE